MFWIIVKEKLKQFMSSSLNSGLFTHISFVFPPFWTVFNADIMFDCSPVLRTEKFFVCFSEIRFYEFEIFPQFRCSLTLNWFLTNKWIFFTLFQVFWTQRHTQRKSIRIEVLWAFWSIHKLAYLIATLRKYFFASFLNVWLVNVTRIYWMLNFLW